MQVLLLLLAPVATGQITMEQAVQRALTVAPELTAAAEGEEAALAKVEQARSAYLPRINLDAQYSVRSFKNELPLQLPPGVPPVGDIDDIHQFQAGISVGYRVLDFSRGPRTEAAEDAFAAQQAESEEMASKLAMEVRATFLAALFARDVQRISQASLQVAEQEEKRASLRAEVGTGTQVALAQARVRLAGLRAQERRAEHELMRYKKQLAQMLDLEALPELVGDLAQLASPLPTLSLDGNPQLQKLQASSDAAQKVASSRSRTLIPTLSVMGAAQLSYPRGFELELLPIYLFGVSLEWPAFDGFLRENEVAEKEAQARQLGELKRAASERLSRKLIDLEARAQTATADLSSAEETLKQTEVYLRVAKAAVDAGAGTELDVHNAELGLDQARIAVKKALLESALVRAEKLMVYGLSTEHRGLVSGARSERNHARTRSLERGRM